MLEKEEGRPLGRRHPLLQRLRALRRDGALRRSESVFVAEGIHLAREALASRLRIDSVVIAPRLRRNAEGLALIEEIRTRGLDCHETTDERLAQAQDARSPQPIVMIVERPLWNAETILGDANPLVVVAWGLQDPGNLGNLFRTAHAAGATACLLQGPSADAFHPRTVRASAGAAFRLPTLADGSGELLERLARGRVALIATAADGTTDYPACDFTGPSAILFGAEGDGLPPELTERAARVVRIPLTDDVESLSVSSAAAVILFEAARQRGREAG
jgi:TrmH family RNA methyltransferase